MDTRQILQSFKERKISRAEALTLLKGGAGPRREPTGKKIAIIGMAGRFPGARNLEEYWSNLERGVDCITEVDASRWDVNAVYDPNPAAPGKSCSKWAGLIADIDCFDPLFFNISPLEAELIDPQQRLFLESAWAAIEDSGHAPGELSGMDCGVFVGAGRGDYEDTLKEKQVGAEAFAFMGNAPSILAARISYVLNLKGASMTVDTACSSSLVAIHQACQSIWSGENVMALAGGVSLLLTPELHIMSSKTGMLARDGRCKTFDDSADGFVPGEGVAVLVLKDFDLAVADADHIHGVIVGSGVNQDGSTNGITAPSADSQKRLECRVYEKFGIDVSRIRYVECHGTGTKLGDPIELDALNQAFGQFTQDRHYCAIGSVKANIGHTLHAAGIAGVIKVLLAMRAGKIPPALHVKQQNRHIDLTDSPFYINTQLEAWDRHGPEGTFAAVSSFGFSGTNAHLVIEKYGATSRESTGPASASPSLIVLSARTREQLEEQARQLAAFVDSEGGRSAHLSQIAFTLQTGRDAMRFRLALLAADLAELKEKLTRFLSGAQDIPELWQGTLRANQTAEELAPGELKALRAAGRLDEIARRWALGARGDWNCLYPDRKPRRISLPTYPFARKRFWAASPAPSPERAASTTQVPPDRRAWPDVALTLAAQEGSRYVFRASFAATQTLVKEHLVAGRLVVPGCALIEMLLKAVGTIEPERMAMLRDFLWLQPIVVGPSGEDVHLELIRSECEFQHRFFSVREGTQVVHAQGRVVLTDRAVTRDHVDIARVRSAMTPIVEEREQAERFYEEFAAAGIAYGPYFRSVVGLSRANDQCVGTLRLSASLADETGRHYVSPAILDAALQCVAAFREGDTLEPRVPFSIGELTVCAPLEREMFVLAMRCSEDRYDVRLLNSAGQVCVECRGFVVRALSRKEEPITYIARWSRVRPSNTESSVEKRAIGATLLVRLSEESPFIEHLRSADENVLELFLDGGLTGSTGSPAALDIADPNAFAAALAPIGPISRVLFVTGLQLAGTSALDTGMLLRSYAYTEGALFSLIQALAQLQYDEQPLQLAVLTRDIAGLHECPSALGAGLQGLAGTLAKEHAKWRVTCLDLSSDDLADARRHSQLAAFVLHEPPDPRGAPVAYRSGIRYEQQLFPLSLPTGTRTAFRRDGVYVIVGGAGGLGLVTTRHLIEHYDAQVIWVGRRPENDDITRALDEAARLGKRPRYLRCDISSREELAAALSVIRKEFEVIHGVIHSALVLRDNSLKKMTEAELRSVLAPKVAGTAMLCEAFRDVALDWMCFYSSGQSFLCAPLQGNYAAASVYQDAIARCFGTLVRYPVHIINWGYWGSVGVVATRTHRDLMSARGVESLEPEEGMSVLESILASQVPQVAVLKGSLSAKRQVGVRETRSICLHPPCETPVVLDLPAGLAACEGSRTPGPNLELDLEAYVLAGLSATLRELGVQRLRDTGLTLTEARRALGIVDKYERLFRVIAGVLERGGLLREVDGLITFDGHADAIAAALPTREATLQRGYPMLAPHLALLKSCLSRLSDVLAGKKSATEVIFPSSSMAPLEAIYKSDIANLYNERVAEVVRAYAQRWLQEAKSGGRLRILEVGAGTGSTSVALFRALKPFADRIEYVYTDLSAAFLAEAQRKYAGLLPHFSTRVFDIERAASEQGFEADEIDIVVASNVIHATRDVCATLENIKAVLRNRGLLVLNEVTGRSLLTTFTFGLLDGWWLFEDAETRLPDSPMLSTDQWRCVLQDCGFVDVKIADPDAGSLAQNVIAGLSDGYVSASARSRSLPARPPAPPIARAVVASVRAVPALSTTEVERRLFAIISDVLKVPASDLDSDVQFSEYGVDSIMAVKLTELVGQAFDVTLNSTDLFNYSSVDALSRHVAQLAATRAAAAEPAEANTTSEIVASAGEAPGEAASPRPVEPPSEKVHAGEIAIIGMSGRFAAARSLAEFWSAVSQGATLLREVPQTRKALSTGWELSGDAAAEIYCRVGGFLDDIECFDAPFFQITGIEARNTDPQQRFFLEEAWRAIEDAGYNPKSLAGSRCGVFVGVGGSDYTLVENAERQTPAFWGNASSVLAARIAYYLDLKGGAVAIDTACSSSLVALHAACQSLWTQENDTALAGGVFIQSTPVFYQSTCRAGMLSRGGACHTFDHRADGFVPGEGVGVCLLKRLADAQRDGDHIYGVIRAIGVNQDGTTNGITAPNSLSQSELVSGLYEKFSIDPASIQCIEAHGTGTKLGDPIEVQALVRSFDRGEVARGSCAIGSVKSNMGHAATAAGVAGLMKVLLAFQHRRIPPSIQFERANPHIDFEHSPFYVNTQLRDWSESPGARRRAAVSSFGFSGTNAHVVLEEYVDEALPVRARPHPPGTAVLVPLSAKNEERLNLAARNLLAFLEAARERDSLPGLDDLAGTLQVGREEMDARAIFIVEGFPQLIDALRRFVSGGAPGDAWLTGRRDKKSALTRLINSTTQFEQLVERSVTDGALRDIAELWVGGIAVDWTRVQGVCGRAWRRVSLPTYPFAPEVHWWPLKARESAAPVVPPEPTTPSRLLTIFGTDWVSAERSSSGTDVAGAVCILANEETEALARSLATHFAGARVLMPREVQSEHSRQGSCTDVGGVIDLTGLGERESSQEIDWLVWMQDVLRDSTQPGIRLLLVTSHLEPFENARMKLTGAERVGFYRSVQEEYSRVSARHLDLEMMRPGGEAELIERILGEWHCDSRESAVCYRAGKRYVPVRATRLQHEEIVSLARQARPVIAPSEVIWITGGTRGIGMRCARHFVTAYGAKKLVLMGKEALPERSAWASYAERADADAATLEKIRNVEWLESQGVEVRLITGEVLLDRRQLKEEAQKVLREMGEVVGVLHCAGSYDVQNPAFVRKDRKSMERVMSPKVQGLKNLCETLAGDRLKFFVLFSSISTAVPALSAGQIEYSTANTYLDYVAAYWRARGNLRIWSLQWPNWKESGLGQISSRRYRDSGYVSHTDAEGLMLLDAVLSSQTGPVVLPTVTEVDRTPREPTESAANPTAPGSEPDVERWLMEVVARELAVRIETLDAECPFQEYGVDSILLAQLVARIDRELGEVHLDPAAIIDYPSIRQLGGYLLANHKDALSKKFSSPHANAPPPEKPAPRETGGRALSAAPVPVTVRESRSEPDQRIAVVGMACHFPRSPDLESFWRNLEAGVDCVSEVPKTRWDTSALYRPTHETGRSISKWGGFIEGIEQFDPAFFGIPEDLAPFIDPLSRQWLEVSAEALADAGYDRRDLWGHRVGVFGGARTGNFVQKLGRLKKDAIVGIGQNFITAHLAHLYNFAGPNMVIDTACASALTAIHLAAASLRLGESELALAGGVEILLDEAPYLLLSEGRVLSADGRCKTFDESADGIGIGEGCGVLVLKPLAAAIRDGNKIYGVIDGSALNNDGNTMGVTTPNPDRQRELIEDAIRNAQVDPATISYIEAHGTGTMIGDPIELRGLSRIFAGERRCPEGLAIGSVKSNVGHLLSASGAAGVVKVLLALIHEQLPPTIHCANPNRRFNFVHSGIRPVRQVERWRSSSGVLRAGVSSFGFGGHNAHILLSNEGVPRERRATCHPVKSAVRYQKKRYWPTAAPDLTERESFAGFFEFEEV